MKKVFFVGLLILGVILSMQGCKDVSCTDSAVDEEGIEFSELENFAHRQHISVFPIDFSFNEGNHQMLLSKTVSSDLSLKPYWDQAFEVSHDPLIMEIPLNESAYLMKNGKESYSCLVMQKRGNNDFFCYVKTVMQPAGEHGETSSDRLIIFSTTKGMYSNACLKTLGGKTYPIKVKIEKNILADNPRSRAIEVPFFLSAMSASDSLFSTTPTICSKCNLSPCECQPTTEITTGMEVDITKDSTTTSFHICGLCNSYPCKCWNIIDSTIKTEDPNWPINRCPKCHFYPCTCGYMSPCSYCGSTTCIKSLRWCDKCHFFHCDTRCFGPCALCKTYNRECCRECKTTVCVCIGKICYHNHTHPCDKSLNAKICSVCDGPCECISRGVCCHNKTCEGCVGMHL